MSVDRRAFLKAGISTACLMGLRSAGRVILTRIVPALSRTVPRWRFNLLRFGRP